MSSGYGIASAIGAAAGAGISAAAANKQGKKQRKFIRELRSTAFQVQTEDLRQAGINPLLAFGGGGGGASGAAVAQGQLPNLGDFGAGAVGQGISTALEKRRADQEIKNMKMDVNLKNAQKFREIDDAVLKRGQHRLVDQQTKLVKVQTSAAALGLPAARTEAQIENSAFGEWTRYINRIKNTINPLQRSPSGGKGKR